MDVSPWHKSLLAFALLVVIAVSTGPVASSSEAAPSCAEGPQIEGDTIRGTPCDDTIRAPRGVTTVFGEGGNDSLYGQRGNDSLFGGEGNDRLYGGVGDDRVRGGPDNDLLSGGFGADSLDGEAGNDFARGDATIDTIADSGGGTDTLSYATGATPGFFDRPGVSDYEHFPASREGRGAYVNLQSGLGDNGLAPEGGGVDEDVEGTSFEIVIGSAFPDFIVGTSASQTIYGGGGADAILGEGGSDVVYGGADGDSCEAATTFECESSDEEVQLRDPGAIAVGSMAPQSDQSPALYLTGSDENDVVSANYAPGSVTFTLGAGSEGGFDTSAAAAGGCGAPAGGKVVCSVTAAPDSVVLAGLDGEDSLTASGFPETTSIVVLGGNGGDSLTGGATEDALVDGGGDDLVDAAGGDDAVPNNEGKDSLHAGPGEDLFISNSVCNGDLLDGGGDRDNANWANFGSAISIDMGARKAGLVGPAGSPQCPSASLLTSMEAIEDIEGTNGNDTLVGDAGENQLLGRPGHDSYFAAGGNDSILANSGDEDVVVDCGEGFDTAQVDHPEYNDPAPVDCEAIHERDPNSFRPPDTPPNPNPPAEEAPAAASPPPAPPLRPSNPSKKGVPDLDPPRTTILHRPPAVLFASGPRRAAKFFFAASERGATFRCRIDRSPFIPCRSPRLYRLAPGRHAFRVFAIDRAGNRDRTPAVLRVRVRRA
jgi:Ca2+-binding RTX toxin-like protein